MLNISEAAQAKIADILAEEEAYALRIFVQGGGCSGFQYGFTLDEKQEDDTEFTFDSVKVLIDSMSLMYVNDATVDYKEELLGSRFVINNPNVTASCGCGSSFTTI